MSQEKLSRSEQKILRQQIRPAILFALGLLIVISVFNVVIFYRDIIIGTEGVERPPLSQLISIQITGFIIAFAVFYFSSKKTLKDLTSKLKKTEVLEIGFKFIQNKEGKPVCTLKMKNSLIVPVEPKFYKSVHVGNLLEIHYAPESLYILEVRFIENNNER